MFYATLLRLSCADDNAGMQGDGHVPLCVTSSLSPCPAPAEAPAREVSRERCAEQRREAGCSAPSLKIKKTSFRLLIHFGLEAMCSQNEVVLRSLAEPCGAMTLQNSILRTEKAFAKKGIAFLSK